MASFQQLLIHALNLAGPTYLCFNSSQSNAAYMRHWTGSSLVQWLVACSAPRHYLNQCWSIVNWTPVNKFQWNLNLNSIIFIQENAFENVVCQHGSHFVQGRWVKRGPGSCCNTMGRINMVVAQKPRLHRISSKKHQSAPQLDVFAINSLRTSWHKDH